MDCAGVGAVSVLVLEKEWVHVAEANRRHVFSGQSTGGRASKSPPLELCSSRGVVATFMQTRLTKHAVVLFEVPYSVQIPGDEWVHLQSILGLRLVGGKNSTEKWEGRKLVVLAHFDKTLHPPNQPSSPPWLSSVNSLPASQIRHTRSGTSSLGMVGSMQEAVASDITLQAANRRGCAALVSERGFGTRGGATIKVVYKRHNRVLSTALQIRRHLPKHLSLTKNAVRDLLQNPKNRNYIALKEAEMYSRHQTSTIRKALLLKGQICNFPNIVK